MLTSGMSGTANNLLNGTAQHYTVSAVNSASNLSPSRKPFMATLRRRIEISPVM